MYSKTLCTFTFVFTLITASFSQRLMHEFGTTFSIMFGKIKTPYSSSDFTLSQSTITYFPRYNFVGETNSSVSIGAPVGVGIGIVSNTYGSDVGLSFAYDLPVVLDYNFGCKATKNSDKKFGGYAGLGLGYYKVNISHSTYSNFNGATYGPIVRAGVRIGSISSSWGDRAIDIGLYYKKGLETAKFSTVGVHVLYAL